MTELMIFDLDGVLIDSEPLHIRAHEAVYMQEFNGARELPLESISGQSAFDFYVRLFHELGEEEPETERVEELCALHFKTIFDIIINSNAPPTSGLKELIDTLKARRIKVGVASSSHRAYVYGILAHIGISDDVDFVACGDEVAQMKPAPDVYLRVLEQSGVDAQNALALEDSATGAQAATCAGIRCLGFSPVPLAHTFCCVSSMTQVLEHIE